MKKRIFFKYFEIPRSSRFPTLHYIVTLTYYNICIHNINYNVKVKSSNGALQEDHPKNQPDPDSHTTAMYLAPMS